MMKIFGHPMSTCTRKVLFTLNETNTPYELQVVDFAKGEHKMPAHLAHQPFGQLPALKDGNFEMFESRAMARYIDRQAGGKLTPKDSHDEAHMEQWISVESANFTPHAMTFIYHGIFKREQSAEALANAGTKLENCVAIMDKHLATSKKSFLVGDQMTIADIAYAPYVDYSMNTDAKAIYSKHPHFTAWWNRVSERPSWHKAAGRA
jgi:glutathione S-transferase